MNGDHPTTGDMAMNEARSNSLHVAALSQKVDDCAAHIDFLVDVINALLDHMYGPDDKGKPDLVLKVVKDFALRTL